MTKEHLGYALALKLPAFVVVNKVDVSKPAQLERTLVQLERLIKGPGCGKIPFRVEHEQDAIATAHNFNLERFHHHLTFSINFVVV